MANSLLTCSCSSAQKTTFVCKQEIAKHDTNAWNTIINEIANVDCPAIYLTSDAAYFLLQATLVYYTSPELSLKLNNQNEFADQIMLVNYKNFQYKKGENSSTTSAFKYSYENLLGDANGKRNEYKDILKYAWKKEVIWWLLILKTSMQTRKNIQNMQMIKIICFDCMNMILLKKF